MISNSYIICVKPFLNMSTSPNTIRITKPTRMRRVDHVVRMEEMRNPHKILVGKPKQKTPLRRSAHTWEGNFIMVVGIIRWKFVNWMHVTKDRDQKWAVVNTVMNHRVT
jgi:hypothetical protein